MYIHTDTDRYKTEMARKIRANIFIIYLIVIAIGFCTIIVYMNMIDKKLGMKFKIDKRNIFITSADMEGIKFNVSPYLLHAIGLPHLYFDERISNMDKAQQFVFATYANEVYFPQLKRAIDRIQKVFPGRKTVIYNIGLSIEQSQEVQSWCNVIYRVFEFDKYPKHVRSLRTYAFKALVWHQVLEEFEAAFFVDATILVSTFDVDSIIEAAVKSGGLLLFSKTGHSNYAVTHPQMYKYFPVSIEALKTTEQLESEAFVIYNKLTYWKILHWAFMCALDPDCISPKGSTRFCEFNDDRFKTYARCHRYDQSVLNLLAVDAFVDNLNSWRFSNENERVYAVRRYAMRKPSLYNITTC